MKLKNVVFVALVAFLKVLAENYLPAFPITAELINSLLLALLGLVGVDVVEYAARNSRFAANFK
jgi:hypothetical protein